MRKCSVAVTVDGWQAMGDVAPKFRVGEPITGTVHVFVNAPVRCDGLDVRLLPIRTGQAAPGYYLGTKLPAVRLFEGDWEAGEYEYGFSLPSHWLPSYEGRHLAWIWVARARADIPWALDPDGESGLRLEFAEPPVGVDITPIGGPSEDEATTTSGGKLQSALSWVMLLSLLMIAAGLLGKFFDVGAEGVTGGLAGAGLVVFVVSGLVLGATSGSAPEKKRSETTAGSVAQVELTQRRGGRDYRSGGGDVIHCAVQTKGKVTSVRARLLVQEYAEWTKTTNEHTTTHRYAHVFDEQDVALTQRDSSSSWRGSLRVPDPSAVPCFSVGNPPGCGLVWKVELWTTLQGKSEPEVSCRFLKVRPRFS